MQALETIVTVMASLFLVGLTMGTLALLIALFITMKFK